MGKQKTGKEASKPGKENLRERSGGKAQAQLPQADRVVAVSAPLLAPPQTQEDEAVIGGEETLL
eukprot:1072710-Amphidinium_carterae.1